MKIILIKKAYQINLSKIEEGFLYSDITCHAENRNHAKSILLKQNRYEGLCLLGTYKEVDYLTIPVIRCKSADIVSFLGKEIVRSQIDQIIIERERIAQLKEIENNPHIKYCYIIKGNYYRPNSCGYTSRKSEAGVYPKKEAISHAKFSSEIRLEIIDIDEHNKMINDKIRDLKSRIIS